MGDFGGRRGHRSDAGEARVERLPTARELAADDRFLDALAAGEREVCGAGMYGTDSYLAALFADAREAAGADLPPVPSIDHAEAVAHRDVVDVEVVASEEELDDAGVDGPEVAADGAGAGAGAGRSRRASWWKPSRVSSALIGAAASFVLFAGAGTAVHAAGPGSALWPVRVSLFGSDSVEVELASTLHEADAASRAGDVDRAQSLLERAERLMAEVGAANRAEMENQMRETVERVRTVTAVPETVTNERTATRTTTRTATRTADPHTVTRTETRTETVTETAPQPPAAPGAPAEPGEPEVPQPPAPPAPGDAVSEPLGARRPVPSVAQAPVHTPVQPVPRAIPQQVPDAARQPQPTVESVPEAESAPAPQADAAGNR